MLDIRLAKSDYFEMTQRKRLILFPDSNLFFQYRALGELPWKEIGDYDEIELIVCRPVQKEIDRHKGGGNDRRQRRARQAASILREIIKNNGAPHTVCQGLPMVKLALRVDLKPDQGLADKLDYAEPDDTLVGIARGFAGTSDAEVAVLTDDAGVMASAGAVSINYIPIRDEWRLEPETIKEAKELKVAQAEIARLQRLEPAFDVECFDGGGSLVTSLEFQFPKASPLTQQEIAGLLDQARLLFPLKTDFSAPTRHASTPGRVGISLESLRDVRSPPTEQQIAEYNKAYEEWLVELETALKTIHLRVVGDETDGSFSFSARNTGTRPANDILVEIIAHGPFLIGRPPKKDDEERDAAGLTSPPAIPELHVSALDTMLRMSEILGLGHGRGHTFTPLIDTHFPRERDTEAFYYQGGHSRFADESLALECSLWRHGREPETFRAEIEADTDTDARGAIEFRVHASNLSNIVSRKIPVRITFEDLLTYDYALQAIDELTSVAKR